ncbi:MAG: DNA adenine methylase [Gemmatimonadaceae bacterium]|nr:DNA adenine methylase [Gemmatimonadaceae bacterium]
MIKYIGSKRRLVPQILRLVQAIPRAHTVLDLFTGTTRVAQGLKRAGYFVTANDLASYSELLATTYIATDAAAVDELALAGMIAELNALPGQRGYFTRTFCEEARYLQPQNGMRVDAIRARIEAMQVNAGTRAILLTALLEAADRVDSTTGIQMAYLKQWSARSHSPLTLRVPQLIEGPGRAMRADAREAIRGVDTYDVAYLDPPYNQHSYYRNYHVWETLVRGDEPSTYGIARKRADARTTRSAFNLRGEAWQALREVVLGLRARHVVLSFSDEGFFTVEAIRDLLAERCGEVAALAVPSARYVGAKIGIHDLKGVLVGEVGHLTNTEWLFVGGPDAAGIVRRATENGRADSEVA